VSTLVCKHLTQCTGGLAGRSTNLYEFGWGTGQGWAADKMQGRVQLQANVWQHLLLSADFDAHLITIWLNGKIVATREYKSKVKQCPKGTVLEIGDGWARGDSRRWQGEMRRFAMYTLPKGPTDVAKLYSTFVHDASERTSSCLSATTTGVHGRSWCDATRAGGGWTLVAKIKNQGDTWAYNSKLWTTSGESQRASLEPRPFSTIRLSQTQEAATVTESDGSDPCQHRRQVH
jgi:hypothetical protein